MDIVVRTGGHSCKEFVDIVVRTGGQRVLRIRIGVGSLKGCQGGGQGHLLVVAKAYHDFLGHIFKTRLPQHYK